MVTDNVNFINETVIGQTLEKAGRRDGQAVRAILSKSLELKGLGMEDIAVLASINDPELLDALFDAAQRVKETIYGRRLVIFAPLYISNLCGNECLYCAFRAQNVSVRRRALTQAEISREVEILVKQGHKRVLWSRASRTPMKGLTMCSRPLIRSMARRSATARFGGSMSILRAVAGRIQTAQGG